MSCLLAAPGVAVNSAKLVGATPLHAACVQGQAAVVSALLAHPAVTVSPRTTRVWGHYPAGSTPLLIARAMGRLDIAALLEARGGVL